MDAYVRIKAIRYKVPDEILVEYKVEDLYDFLEAKQKESKEIDELVKKGKLQAIYTHNGMGFIDYVYCVLYDEDNAKYVLSHLLTNKEFDLIIPLFSLIRKNLDINDFRRVKYSYYNCCEPPNCFDVIEDEFTENNLPKLFRGKCKTMKECKKERKNES